MSFGLLRGAFRPPEDVVVLRSLVRQRSTLLRDQTRHIQHIQKALVQMNVQLGTVIADVVGATGQRIIRAILKGERNPTVLAKLRDPRIAAPEEEIARSLEGTWRKEHLFALKQAVDAYDFLQGQVRECDVEIEAQMKVLKVTEGAPAKRKMGGKPRNAPHFDVRERLYEMAAVDLTLINGIDGTTAMTLMSEIGRDVERFPSAGHFASWLGLCPGTKITGGKVLSAKTRRVQNRATRALKMAASNLRNSKSALGAYHRRMCSRMDKPKAITATAHKLARLIYSMLKHGEEYVDKGQEAYEKRHTQNMINQLAKKAQRLGFALVENKPEA